MCFLGSRLIIVIDYTCRFRYIPRDRWVMSQTDGRTDGRTDRQTDRLTPRQTLRVSSAPLLARLWPLLAKARLVISVEGSWALRMTRPPPDTYRQSCLAIICGLGGITTPVDAAVPNFPANNRPTMSSVYATFQSMCPSFL